MRNLKFSADSPRPHHTQNGFKNLHTPPVNKSIFGFVKMRYVDKEPFSNQKKDAHLVPIAEPDFEAIKHPSSSLQATWMGHSTFYTQLAGRSFITDPVLGKRASPLKVGDPKRLVPTPLKIKDLPSVDFALISHNHYDHLDLDTIKELGNNCHYLVPLGLKRWFVKRGIKRQNITEFDWWDALDIDGFTITATPCQHWSARGLHDKNKSLWCSFHVSDGTQSFWFAGDTGYNDIQFKEIGKTFSPINLALVPIGAYAPRWFMKQQHVNPEEAIQIHQDIGARKSIGMHWGTFQLTAEPIMEPAQRIEKAKQEGVITKDEFVTIAIGETFVYT